MRTKNKAEAKQGEVAVVNFAETAPVLGHSLVPKILIEEEEALVPFGLLMVTSGHAASQPLQLLLQHLPASCAMPQQLQTAVSSIVCCCLENQII